MKPIKLLQGINALHNTLFKLIERYSTGEQGAFSIIDDDQKRYVLKWSDGTHHLFMLEGAVKTTQHLRQFGYPAPCYLFTGIVAEGSYSIQESLSGKPMNILTREYLSRLIELNTMQVGQAVLQQDVWPMRVIDTVLFGGNGYCVIETLRTYSSTTAELLAMLQAVVSKHKGDSYRTNDIVHYDFHFANILVDDGKVSGVIDWDGTCSGDAGFDLATLLCYSYTQINEAVISQLWRTGLELSGPGPFSVYLAHMIIRQVNWSIRYYEQDAVERWLCIAGEILRDMRYRAF